MMDLRILTLLVIVFGVVYSHTTPHNDEYNFIKLFEMMTKLQEHVTNLQNQQQQLKIKVMDSMDKQNEKLSNFEAKVMDSMDNFEAKMIDSMNKQDEKSSSLEVKVMDSMDKQNEKLSNFEVKVDSLVKENENFEGKIQNLQETLTEQYDQIEFHLQIEGGTINNNYYGCDNSTTMPPTQPPVTNAQDCTEVYSKGFTSEGVYAIKPANSEALDVYCQDGWTLLQKRTDDSVNYTRNMEEYERGFGSVHGEHWIGLNAMHELTEQGSYTVRFELEDFDGETRWAEYTNFHVDSSPSYTLLFDYNSYKGTARDSLGHNHGRSFSTFDVDQDTWSDNSCSTHILPDGSSFGGGGWWFGDCGWTITTGMPYGSTFSIMWIDWRQYDGLKSVIMKIKRD